MSFHIWFYLISVLVSQLHLSSSSLALTPVFKVLLGWLQGVKSAQGPSEQIIYPPSPYIKITSVTGFSGVFYIICLCSHHHYNNHQPHTIIKVQCSKLMVENNGLPGRTSFEPRRLLPQFFPLLTVNSASTVQFFTPKACYGKYIPQ